MTQWADLRHAYGAAEDVPNLLKHLEQNPSDELIGDLWSALCHQGTVYTASFAALPILVEIAGRLTGKWRLNALVLAGAIVASDDVVGERPDAVVEGVTGDLNRLIAETMTDSSFDDQTFIYLMQAAAAANGEMFWARNFDRLAGDEFPGQCPACASGLYFAIGKNGYFTTHQDYVANTNGPRAPIEPSIVSNLPADGVWLERLAATQGRDELAKRILYIFGASRCTACQVGLSVSEAIHLFEAGSSNAEN